MSNDRITVETDEYDLTTYQYDRNNWTQKGKTVLVPATTSSQQKATLVFSTDVDLIGDINKIIEISSKKNQSEQDNSYGFSMLAENEEQSRFIFDLETVKRGE